jgi:glycosyltransferase involved in cell wall biosynthesis
MSERIRVLFTIGSMAGGGSERQMLSVLRHLDRARFTPLLYLVDRRGELLHEVPADVPVFAFSDRARPIRWNFPGRIHRAQVRDLARVLREARIDVIYERTFFMTLIAAAAARRVPSSSRGVAGGPRRTVPRIAVIVSNPARDLAQTAGRFLRWKRWLLRKAYREAARVVAVSEGVRRSARDYYELPADRIVTAYNFVDLERIDREANARGSVAGVNPRDPRRFHIIAAGRLQEEKGFLYLLEAMQDLVHRRGRKEVWLHILGQGRQEAELREFVRTNRLEDHVCIAGFVENPFVYFRSADLFCLPSLYEGMPNVLIEALTCGVPVLATDCESGPAEILAGGRYGKLVPPADAHALADAIEDAVLRPDQWRSLLPAARAHVDEFFSLRSGVARVEAMLEDVVRGTDLTSKQPL